MPSEQVANPELVDKPRHMAWRGTFNQQAATIAYSVETRIRPAKDGIAVSLRLVDSTTQRDYDAVRPVMRPVGWISPNAWEPCSSRDCSRSEHVDLANAPKDKEVLGHSSPWNQPTCSRSEHIDLANAPKDKEVLGHSSPWNPPRTPHLRPQKVSTPPAPYESALHNHSSCGCTVRFMEQPCMPCMRWKHGQGGRAQQCRYEESNKDEQKDLVHGEAGLQQESGSKQNLLTDSSRSIHRHISERSKQGSQTHTPSTDTIVECRNVYEKSQNTSTDLTDMRERPITCLTPTVVGTSEKCHIVVYRESSEGNSASYLDMIPQLHVVQGKKTTTFGLVSPKLNRRRPPKQDHLQDKNTLSPLANEPRRDTQLLPSRTHMSNVKQPKTRGTLLPSLNTEMSLLQSGIACLTGGSDRSNRAVVEVYGDHQHWRFPLLSSLELSVLMFYFHTITRKEFGELGLTIVFDARKMQPHPKFTEALEMMHEQDPHAVHSVLLLMNKEKSYAQQKYPGGMEVVTSLKALYKCVDSSQLSPALGGSYPYRHKEWLDLHQELHPFVLDLKATTNLLLEAIRKLDGVHKIDTVQDVQQCMDKHGALMKEVLQDTRLVTLQREGGAMLARLRWESDVRSVHCERSREIMDTVEDLYNQVEEQVHVLAKRSNMSLQHLNFLLQLRELESKFAKIKEWFDVEGERQLLEAESVEEFSGRIQETLQSFTSFLSEANEQKHHALMLVTEAEGIEGPNYPETEAFHAMVSTFKKSLLDFLSRAEQCCDELATMVHLCQFCERAAEVAENCSQQLELERLQSMTQQEREIALQQCHETLSEFSPEHFQEVKAHGCSLQSSRGLQVWNVTWQRCQEVWQQLEDRLQDLKETQDSLVPESSFLCEWSDDGRSHKFPEVFPDGLKVIPQPVLQQKSVEPSRSEMELPQNRNSIHGTVTCFNINFRQNRKARKGSRTAQFTDREPAGSTRNVSQGRRQKTVKGSDTVGCQWFPWQHNNSRKHIRNGTGSASSTSETQNLIATSDTPPTTAPTFSGSQTQVSSSVPQTQVPTSSVPQNQSLSDSFSQDALCFGPEISGKPSQFLQEDTVSLAGEVPSDSGIGINDMKLQHVMKELLLTEVEYVRSLSYILTHYLPLLARHDVPPDLRGQRGRIFGNLEKLHNFHRHYFLPELEACRDEPLTVGRCFLRHRENFGLYALYSKNKPQSDALIQQHKFFKIKQQELGDNMDLSSYLLKPVQRVSKYSLLLQEMLAECGPNWDQNWNQDHLRLEIQAAAEVVRFQLRHGNDLLTMDAIRDCDVNLKEQGKLIRQDEFYVTFRKKRSLRRVFLFQELILFTKTKKTLGGDEVYLYKQSFKTCDIGLTHNSGQSGLCFEIWFRRRRAQDTLMLQAERQEVKRAWTSDLEQILWEQAMKNRELRRQERVLMGASSKVFMDIQHSEAAIHDRNIQYLLPKTEIEGLSNLMSNLQTDVSIPRPDSTGSASHSSSSSGRGSLSPCTFHRNHRISLTIENHNGPRTTDDAIGCTQDCVCMFGGSNSSSEARSKLNTSSPD